MRLINNSEIGKRILAFLLVIVMLFSITPLTNFITLIEQVSAKVMDIDRAGRENMVWASNATPTQPESNTFAFYDENHKRLDETNDNKGYVIISATENSCQYYLGDNDGNRIDNVTYEVVHNNSVALVDEDGKVTKIQDGFVEIKATYNQISKKYVICFLGETVINFNEFMNNVISTTNYGKEQIANIQTPISDERNISYSIEDNNGNPSSLIELNNGVISKCNGAGNVKIIAKVQRETVLFPVEDEDWGKTYYDEAEISYDLEIKLSGRTTFEFEQEIGESTTKYHGMSFRNRALIDKSDNSIIMYSSSDESIASVDNSGNVSINGEVNEPTVITITATALENNIYKEESINYSFTVAPSTIDNESYKFSGLYDETTGWYRGAEEVKILGSTDEDGNVYKVSTTNDMSYDSWKDNIDVEVGQHTYEFYTRKMSGENKGTISNKKSVLIKWDPKVDNIDLTSESSTGVWHNSDVIVKLSASDEVSGISSYSYYTQVGNEISQTINTEIDENQKNKISDIPIVLSASEFDGKDVTLHVNVTDVAGNTISKSIAYKFDKTSPEVTVDFDNNSLFQKKDNRGYFSGTRTATITAKDINFDTSKAKINIKALDRSGNELDISNLVSITDWYTNDNITYTARVFFVGDANYTWSVSCSDLAGNTNSTINYRGSKTPVEFTIDNNLPSGEIKVGEFGPWKKLLNKLSLGYYSSKKLMINASAIDKTSPIYSIKYYKTSSTSLMTVSELEELEEWQEYTDFVVVPNEKFVVYLQVIDYAGNVSYVSTDGIITENKTPDITINMPENATGIYTSDIVAGITVNDATNNSVSSGIKKIDYEIYNMGELTDSGNLYTYNKNEQQSTDLKSILKKNVNISSSNNSNDVQIIIKAEDNSGNKSTEIKKTKIDTTTPEISVEYDNNIANVNNDNAYFNQTRVATITIKERNFNSDDVKIDITNSDGTVPKVSEWKTVKGTKNKDDAKHVATITYKADGDYTFNISYIDEAGNSNKNVDYETSVSPKKFTIDRVNPVINISYDNNSAENGNFYNQHRTATVTIDEHNFNPNDIEFVASAEENGTQIAAPGISGWSKNGDKYSATITFSNNAYYECTLSYKDLAGNTANTIDKQTFYVDTAEPEVTISGIENNTAYNDEGNIGISVECRDDEGNLEDCDVNLTLVQMKDNSFDVVSIDNFKVTDISNGKRYSIGNLERDGKYTLSCVAVDKAGNKHNMNNKKVISFSVNRNGSVYYVDEDSYAQSVFANYYVYEVNKNIEIKEVDVNELKSYKVSLNGEELTEGQDYEVEKSSDDKSWCEYSYILKNSLFEKEGNYSILVESKNKTDTTSYSDIKELKTEFVVDQTEPALTISGITSEGRYQTNEQTVTAIPTDDGGKIKDFKVVVYDKDKSNSSVRFEMEGEKLQEYLAQNDGKIIFTIPEGIKQYVEVSCSDYAIKNDGKTTNNSVSKFEDVTVSANSLVIFYSNTKLFLVVTLLGLGGAGIVVSTIIWRVRRKKIS